MPTVCFDASAIGLDQVPPDHVCDTIVLSLDENVRSNCFQGFKRRVFLENGHDINACQSGQQRSSIVLSR